MLGGVLTKHNTMPSWDMTGETPLALVGYGMKVDEPP